MGEVQSGAGGRGERGQEGVGGGCLNPYVKTP